MKLSFKPSILDYELESLIGEELELIAYSSKIKGIKCHNTNISIEPVDKNQDGYVSISLNRNEATYLRNFLDSFINELPIDVEAED